MFAATSTQKIDRPFLIDKEGAYYYKTNDQTLKTQASSLRVGNIRPPNIESVDGTTNYSSMYGTSVPLIAQYDYEWQPFQEFGKLGVQFGVGYFSAKGNGHFEDGTAAREVYTFHALPLSVGAIYRFQYTHRPYIAPFIAGGGTYYALVEVRDDNKYKAVGTTALYGAGGLLLNITAIDRDTAFTFDTEYGISNLWISLEARQIQSTSNALNFTGLMFSLGLTADY